MRYTGGLLGGTWLTALTGDLGNGMFDGAYLVANFENMHPSNTYWKKLYNLYSKIDTELPGSSNSRSGGATRSCSMPRRCSGSPMSCSSAISSAASCARSTAFAIDLRNIKSPIVVFCSKGRRHHSAAAGVGLDPRPLRSRE